MPRSFPVESRPCHAGFPFLVLAALMGAVALAGCSTNGDSPSRREPAETSPSGREAAVSDRPQEEPEREGDAPRPSGPQPRPSGPARFSVEGRGSTEPSLVRFTTAPGQPPTRPGLQRAATRAAQVTLDGRKRASTEDSVGARFLRSTVLGLGGLGPVGTGNGRDLVLETRIGSAPFTPAAKSVRAGDAIDIRVTSPAGTHLGAPVFVAVDVIRPEPWPRLDLPGELGALGIGAEFLLVVDGQAQILGNSGFLYTLNTASLPALGSGMGVVIQAGVLDLTAPNLLALSPAAQHFGVLPSTLTALASQNMGTGAIFGDSTLVADVNGDGLGDLLVGVTRAYQGGVARSGAVAIFYGPNLAPGPVIGGTHPASYGEFGRDVRVGDVTGDGIPDIVVGARSEHVNGVTLAGAVYVFPGPTFQNPFRIVEPTPEPSARFGHSIALVDWNADGWPDIAVGAQKATSGSGTQAGEVFVFLSPDYTQSMLIPAPASAGGSRFGYGIVGKDLNADGSEDLVIGAPYEDVNTDDDTGAIHIFLSPSTVPSFTISQLADNDAYLGHELDLADFDQDGHIDIVAGAEFDDEGVLDGGSVHVIYGPDWTRRLEISSPDPQEYGGFGSDVDVGDVNDDGFSDIVVGEMFCDPTGADPQGGRGWVFLGPSFSVSLVLSPLTQSLADRAGRRTGCGDLDGDGKADAILAAPFANPGGDPYGGRVYVFSAAPIIGPTGQ